MIRAHCKQMSEFQRVRVIGLKEVGWTNRRIPRHMGRRIRPLKDAGKNGDKSRFQLCLDDDRRRLGQRADFAFKTAHHTSS
ncbi:hypothetical protein TNCV_3208631 [Trichonephila clavipes]|nr:hypothetical protein TNCV_3208631 [Trichonephila clavipes]